MTASRLLGAYASFETVTQAYCPKISFLRREQHDGFPSAQDTEHRHFYLEKSVENWHYICKRTDVANDELTFFEHARKRVRLHHAHMQNSITNPTFFFRPTDDAEPGITCNILRNNK